jgi:very-short-patch-repair endonuclease
MDPKKLQSLLALASVQHHVVSRAQLLALGLSTEEIRHSIASGRLHPVRRGVYAVGRPQIARHGEWMAAVLACGDGAALDGHSAAALWGIRPDEPRRKVTLSVPAEILRRRPDLVVHRRPALRPAHITRHQGIPVTTPALTLVDIARDLRPRDLEGAINEADKRDLIDPDALRVALDDFAGWPGVRPLRKVLDRHTFTLTDTDLERLFLPIARRIGLPVPRTQQWVNGFKVDFYWPDLGLVVETDGLRYHRTAAQQAADRRRDQAHAAAGLVPLRFTRAQVKYEAHHVHATLAAVTSRLRDAR